MFASRLCGRFNSRSTEMVQLPHRRFPPQTWGRWDIELSFYDGPLRCISESLASENWGKFEAALGSPMLPKPVGSSFRHAVEDAIGYDAIRPKIEMPLADVACPFRRSSRGYRKPILGGKVHRRGVIARRFVPSIDVGTTLVVIIASRTLS